MIARVAQSVERWICNLMVQGWSPCSGEFILSIKGWPKKIFLCQETRKCWKISFYTDIYRCSIVVNQVKHAKTIKTYFCFLPGSNRRPCPCKGHVITTTLRKQLVNKHFSLYDFVFFCNVKKCFACMRPRFDPRHLQNFLIISTVVVLWNTPSLLSSLTNEGW